MMSSDSYGAPCCIRPLPMRHRRSCATVENTLNSAGHEHGSRQETGTFSKCVCSLVMTRIESAIRFFQ